MSTTASSIETARENLRTSEIALKQQRREDAKQQLPPLQKQARELLARMKKLHGRFTQRNAEVQAMRSHLLPVWLEYLHFSAPPEWSDEMPEHERAERAELAKQRHATLLVEIEQTEREVERLRRELAEIVSTLPRIENSIHNFQAVARGEL